MKNLGPKSRVWLEQIGVRTVDDLRRLGSIEIYRLLRERGFPVSLNLVYAVEGALTGIDWRDLPVALKAELRVAVKRL